MEITSIIPTYLGFSTKCRRDWLMNAVRSASPCKKILLGVEGEVDQAVLLDLEFDLMDKLQIVVMPDRTDRMNVGDVFNYLVKFVETEWLSICADDDFYCKDILEVLVRGKSDADVVYFPYFCHNLPSRYPHDFGIFNPPPFVEKESLLKCNYISNASITRKELWNKLGGRKLNCVDDWVFHLEALRSGARYGMFPHPVYHQRFYEDSLYQRQVRTWGMEAIRKQLATAAYGEKI